MSGAALVRSDATAIPLGDETVDAIITSPPYFALRSYQDGGEHYDGQIGSEATPTAFLEALWAVTAECWRVLKPTGSLFVNLGDKYCGYTGTKGAQPRSLTGERGDTALVPNGPVSAPSVYGVRSKSLMGLPWRYAIGCIDGQADPDGRGWVLRSEIVWSKPNGLPESVTDRVRRSHEQWFHLTKEGRYYSNVDEVREEHAERTHEQHAIDVRAGLGGSVGGFRGTGVEGRRERSSTPEPNPLGKLPGSVWTVPTQPLIVPDWLDVDHFAAFPTEWPRRLILGWTPPDGVVLDPFGGTGTTAMVARALGRYGVSCDLSADYQRLAKWRIWQSGQAARVAAKTDGERQMAMFTSWPRTRQTPAPPHGRAGPADGAREGAI